MSHPAIFQSLYPPGPLTAQEISQFHINAEVEIQIDITSRCICHRSILWPLYLLQPDGYLTDWNQGDPLRTSHFTGSYARIIDEVFDHREESEIDIRRFTLVAQPYLVETVQFSFPLASDDHVEFLVSQFGIFNIFRHPTQPRHRARLALIPRCYHDVQKKRCEFPFDCV